MCWSNHQAFRGYRPREVGRPQPASRADVRVSDAERNDVIAQLSRHTGDGRLTLEEFEQRVEEALNARTSGDLDTTLRGLPAAPPARGTDRRGDIRAAYRALAPLLLVVLAVAAIGPWVLWFVVPMAMCRLTRRPAHHWHDVEQVRSDRDELTLV